MAQRKHRDVVGERSPASPFEQRLQDGARLRKAAFEPFEPLLDDEAIHALPTREVLDFEPIVGRSLNRRY